MPLPSRRRGARAFAVLALASGVVVGERLRDDEHLPQQACQARGLEAAILNLEAQARVSSAAWPMRSDSKTKAALVQVEQSVSACILEGEGSELAMRRLVKACASITNGPASGKVRQHILRALRWVARGHTTAPSILVRIVQISRASKPLVPPRYVLAVLDAVAQNSAADVATLSAIVAAAEELLRGAELPYSGLERPALFADVLTTLLRFAYSVAPDSQLGLDLLAVARLGSRGSPGSLGSPDYALAQQVALHMLRDMAPWVRTRAGLVAALGLLDACAGAPPILDDGDAAETLEALAEGVPAELLPLVLRSCAQEALLAGNASRAALGAVARRMLSSKVTVSWEIRLQLIADSFALLDYTGSHMPCAHALSLLHELPPLAPASHTAWLSLDVIGVSAPLPAEMLSYVDDFVPPLPEERAVSRILDICGRKVPGALLGLTAVLRASCLRPRRVGLKAARRFAELARESGSAKLRGVVGPSDFAQVGSCLRRSISEPGSSAYIRGIDAAAVHGIASELIAAAEPLLGHWPGEEGLASLQALCALTGNAQGPCRARAAAAPAAGRRSL